MKRPAIIGLAIAAAVAVVLALSALFTVNEAEQALVLQFGEPQHVVTEPGLHVKVPFIQNVDVFSKRGLNFVAPAEELPTIEHEQAVRDCLARHRITDPPRLFQAVRYEAGVPAALRSTISR